MGNPTLADVDVVGCVTAVVADDISTGGGRTAVSVPTTGLVVPGAPAVTVPGAPFSAAGVTGVSPGIDTTVVIVDEVYPTLVVMTVQGT